MSENHEKLFEILEFHFRCNENFVSILDGSVQDYCYLETDNLTSAHYNTVFAFKELTNEILSKYSERLKNAGKTPAVGVIAGTDNDAKCKRLGLELSQETTWMKCNLSEVSLNYEKLENEFFIESNSFPYSEDFLDVFSKSFFVHASEAKEWISAFENSNKNENLDERFFVLYRLGTPVSIAFLASDFSQRFSFLYNVGTHPDFQHQGCSRLLLNHVMKNAQDVGTKEMYLGTQRDSVAEKFYTTLGFSPEGVTHLYTESM